MGLQTKGLQSFGQFDTHRKFSLPDFADLPFRDTFPKRLHCLVEMIGLNLVEGGGSYGCFGDDFRSIIHQFLDFLDGLGEHPFVLRNPKDFIFNTFRCDKLAVFD